MAHLDAYLTRCPAFGWEGSPTFNTTVEQLRNKRTRRNANWTQAQWSFSLPFTNNEMVHYRQVADMHALCRGRLHAFRVRNMLFFHAQRWKFGYGDGSTAEFQLGRLIEQVIAIGEPEVESYLQEVHALSIAADAIPLVVYVDGVPATATFDMRTGKVTFAEAPADDAVLTWDGYFDFWVRFASDALPYTIDDCSGGGFIVNGDTILIQAEPPDAAVPPPA